MIGVIGIIVMLTVFFWMVIDVILDWWDNRDK